MGKFKIKKSQISNSNYLNEYIFVWDLGIK